MALNGSTKTKNHRTNCGRASELQFNATEVYRR